MRMPSGVPPGAVRVDRPSPWGNYASRVVPGVVSRDEAVDLHLLWLVEPEQSEFRERVRRELGGRDLACWCAPRRCHADGLLLVASGSQVDLQVAVGAARRRLGLDA